MNLQMLRQGLCNLILVQYLFVMNHRCTAGNYQLIWHV